MPYRLWTFKFVCAQPQCAQPQCTQPQCTQPQCTQPQCKRQNLTGCGVYKTVRRVLDMDGWYYMGTEYSYRGWYYMGTEYSYRGWYYMGTEYSYRGWYYMGTEYSYRGWYYMGTEYSYRGWYYMGTEYSYRGWYYMGTEYSYRGWYYMETEYSYRGWYYMGTEYSYRGWYYMGTEYSYRGWYYMGTEYSYRGWYYMGTEYLECRLCKKLLAGWSLEVLNQLDTSHRSMFPAILTYRLSCDLKVVTPPPFLDVPSAQWLLTVHGYDVLFQLEDFKARVTSIFGSILKMDSTKKVTKKLAGTAAWATNVVNEYGQVLIKVLTDSEGEGLLDMAAGLQQRYSRSFHLHHFIPCILNVKLGHVVMSCCVLTAVCMGGVIISSSCCHHLHRLM
ncbi:uncharacterized protein LOC135559888 [Oncorhynchus nerka]|uniref:uncharacterized protein LOC135559888 n=1 Tax=Oncorhynchus nerka TaxID=8023 RepID=UPI0031B8908C